MSDLSAVIESQSAMEKTCSHRGSIQLSADKSFCQRQSDVFSALDNLETAHIQVTQDTKAERTAIRKTTWRHTVAAPENLVEQKEGRSSITQTLDCPKDAEFRRPGLPLRVTTRNRPKYNRDMSKWTHYSLADVDEDGGMTGQGGDSNAAIAFAFIRDLKTQKSSNDVEPESKGPHRILFRPSSSKKRRRLDADESGAGEVRTCNKLMDLYDQEDSGSTDNVSLPQASEDHPNKPIFTNRRVRGQFRQSSTESDSVIETNDDYEAVQSKDEEVADVELDSCVTDEPESDDGCDVDGMDFLV